MKSSAGETGQTSPASCTSAHQVLSLKPPSGKRSQQWLWRREAGGDDRDGVGRTLIYKQEPGSNPSSAFRNGVALSESLPS